MQVVNKIADHRKGDTWDGMSLLIEEIKVVDGEDVRTVKDLTGYSALARFKTTRDAHISFEFKTEDDTITIPAPTEGKLLFTERIMDVKANNYVFDVQLTSPEGKVETIADGEWKIFQDVS
jgi:hypothetical protein